MNPQPNLVALLLGLLAAWPVFNISAAHPATGFARASISAAGGSYSPQFSADGRFIIFTSQAQNLTTNDAPNGFLNIYSKEVSSGQITLVSSSSGGGRFPNGSSSSPSVSSNRQFIAFESDATDLVSNDTNTYKDIFLCDTVAGTTTLISISGAGGAANGDSLNPTISPDGRFILFESSAENLVAGDTNRIADLFIRDRVAGTTTLVSVGAQGSPGSPFASVARSGFASTTPDGKNVVFVSTATNLVPGTANVLGEVYVRDLAAGVTTWVSSNSAALGPGPSRSFNPIISPDGRFIVFKTLLLQPPQKTILQLVDLQQGTNQVVTSFADPFGWPAISSDGSKIASEVAPQSIGIWNTAAVPSGPLLIPISNAGFGPIFSPDGNRLAVLGTTTSAVTNQLSGVVQVFVFDLPSGKARLASPNLQKSSSLDLSGTHPSFDPTGNVLVFESFDDEIVQGDNNRATDILLYNWQLNSVELMSTGHNSRPSGTARGLSLAGPAALSADGRYVTLVTMDGTAIPLSKTNLVDFVVWDTQLHTNILLKFLTNPPPANIPIAYRTNLATLRAIVSGPVLSMDGSLLVHVISRPEDLNASGMGHIFALNLQTGDVTWLTPAPEAPDIQLASAVPSISADNKRIVYQSLLNYISTGVPDNNFNLNDVFLYDRVLRTNILVSVNTNASGSGNGASFNPLISPDGRWVLFQGTSSNLVPGTNAYPAGSVQEFARDLLSSNTFLLSASGASMPLSGISTSHVFSLDSRFVAFGGRYLLDSNNFTTAAIFLRDLYAHTNLLVCTNCQNPSLDASATWIVYEKLPAASSAGDIFMQDLRTHQETLLTSAVGANVGGNGISTGPLISSDARYVVFTSKASNLVTNDFNDATDVFVRDRVLNKTTLLSLNRAGTSSGDGSSARPSMSADGRTVIFQSLATDLAERDFNRTRDVFIARLGSGDSDRDGMDDDWELAFFGTLSRGGSGDFDDDGVTDLQEFRGGTDPTNNGSVLRVISLSKLGSGSVTLIWSSVPGKTYSLQFKDTLDASPWQDLAAKITATSETMAAQDSSAAPNRFYRVITAD